MYIRFIFLEAFSITPHLHVIMLFVLTFLLLVYMEMDLYILVVSYFLSFFIVLQPVYGKILQFCWSYIFDGFLLLICGLVAFLEFEVYTLLCSLMLVVMFEVPLYRIYPKNWNRQA